MTQNAGEAAPEIVTEGSGTYEQMGDRAELTVIFSVVARSRSDAVRDLGHRMTAAEPALTQPGLEVRHRRVSVHNEWRGKRLVGCRADEYLALLVTDVAALDAVLSALVGAEPTELRGPNWVLEDPAAAHREAQRRAVANARTRAEGYAAAVGGTLGPLLRLSDGPEHAVGLGYRATAAEAAGPDVRALGLEPEPVRVTARCTTTWALHL